MPSGSNRAFASAFRKELQGELRGRHGFFLSGMFGLMAMAAVSFSMASQSPSPMVASGLFALVVLFSAMTAVPRLYLAEDEQGTFDLVRQWGNCGSLWLGKAVFAAIHQGLTAVLLSVLFSGVVNLKVENWLLWILGAGLVGVASANVLSLTSALVVTAANRWVLAVVVAFPLLFPLLFLGIGMHRVAFGQGSLESAYQSLAALVLYAAVPFGIGPMLAESLWDERQPASKGPSPGGGPPQNGGGS